MEADELYRIEEVRREAALRGDFNKVDEINRSLDIRTKHLPHFQFRDSKIEKEIDKAYLSKELLQLGDSLGSADEGKPPNEDITQYKRFVQNLLDVDLSNVTVAHVPNDYSKAEGQAITCGEDRHIVILPPKGEAFLSADLLVHELGHTGEFTLRRQNNEVNHFVNHKIFNETIAHFCQFRYLKEYGTRVEKISALNSIIPAYMLLKARIAANDMKIQPHTVQTDRLVNHKDFGDFRKVYTTPGLKRSLSTYEGESLFILYHVEIAARFGAVLALKLLNEPEAIKKLCVAPTDKTVRDTLTSLKLRADKLLDFSKADDLFKRFIENTL